MNAETELSQLRSTVQYLKDRQDILDCIMRECRGRDRQDEHLPQAASVHLEIQLQ